MTFTIAKATPTVNVTDAGGTYNGSAFPATVTVTGVQGSAVASLEGVTPTVTYCQGNSCSSTPPTQAGTFTVTANFPGSADYAAAQSVPVTFTIASGIVHVTSANFQQQVMQSQVPVLVDFYADWCEWCQKQTPILETIAGERPDVKVAEINVNESPALAQQFNVDAIPRLMVFRNGQKVADAVGLQTETQLLAMLGCTTDASATYDLPTVISGALGQVAGLPDAGTLPPSGPRLAKGFHRMPGLPEIDAVLASGIWSD